MQDLTQDEWREAMALLDRVMDLDADEQSDVLRRSSASDKIRSTVARLLSHEDTDASALLDQGAFNLVAPVVRADDEFDDKAARALATLGSGTGGRRLRAGELASGTVIGPFRVERLLGHGGMGEVYLARRDDDAYEQQVALKLVRVAGLGSEEVERRFKRERQILADLRHENIARLLDGGVTKDRRPYLVMEYVDGKQITDYANANALNVDERLELFEQACRAVRYAHRRAIIHRDLKPSNLMVEEQQGGSGDGLSGTGRPIVKLLDFGIAKLLEADTEPMTRGGERLMTPEYAAPEQVSGDPVTTSTDVYQLGVLMYELLTGRRPFYEVTEGKSGRARVRAAEDAILGNDPERPSQVMTRSAETLRRTHGTDPKRLAGRVRGDLDSIVQKALRKEPSARYGSVTELLEDLDRYRSGRPVQARRRTWSYRTLKFLRRNRTAVTFSAIAAVLLAAFVVSLVITTNRLSSALTEVRAESEQREKVQDLFMSMVDVANPNDSYTDTLTVRDMLNITQQKAAEQFKASPGLKAWAYTRLASYEYKAGRYAQVLALTDTAVTLYEQVGADGGDSSPKTAIGYTEALSRLSSALREMGQRAEAIDRSRKSLEVFGEARRRAVQPAGMGIFSSSHVDRTFYLAEELRLRHIHLMNTMTVDSADAKTQVDRIEQILQIARSENMTSEIEASVALTLGTLARFWKAQDRLQRAESLYRQQLEMRKRIYGSESTEVASTLNSIGVFYGSRLNNLEKAREYLSRALDVYSRLYYRDDSKMIRRFENLGTVNMFLGDYSIADSLFERALEITKGPNGGGELTNARLLYRKGDVQLRMGNYAQAIAPLEQTARIREENYGRISTATLRAYSKLSEAKWKAGQNAGEAFARTYRAFRTLVQVDDPDAMVNAGRNADTNLSYRRFLNVYLAYLADVQRPGVRCQILVEWDRVSKPDDDPTPEERQLQEDLSACDSGVGA